MKSLLILGTAAFAYGMGYAQIAAIIAAGFGLLYIVYDQPKDPKAKGSGCWAVAMLLMLFWLVVILFFIK